MKKRAMNSWSNGILAAIVASAVLLTTSAAAVDGEILIDQARVNAGGVTPGDAPGFPATLSRPGRYKLTGNLRVPADEDGIVVTQDNVTIDFNGFIISNNPPGQPITGVYAQGVAGLRVVNGTIIGFPDGAIDNLAGVSLVVENMRMLSNGFGVHGGTESRIRNSTIANSTSSGIVCHGRCLIEQNVITGNAAYGIDFIDFPSRGGGMALGNVIVGNGSFGLIGGDEKTGYGNNVLFRNNGGGQQAAANPLHPNVCEPACP